MKNEKSLKRARFEKNIDEGNKYIFEKKNDIQSLYNYEKMNFEEKGIEKTEKGTEKGIEIETEKSIVKKKWESSLDIVKKFSLDEHYNCRIYRNKYKYLKNKKDETFLLLPNIKNKTNSKKKITGKLKHESIEIERVDFEETCFKCNVLFQIIVLESIMHCPRCGISKEIPIYSLPSVESDFFVPKVLQNKARIIDWLQNVQGNDPGEPNPDILQELCEYIVKNKKSDLCEPTSIIIIQEEYKKNGKYLDAQTSIVRLKSKIKNIELDLKDLNANFVKKCWEDIKQRQSNMLNYDDLEKAPIKKVVEKSSKYAYALSGFKPIQFTTEQEAKMKLMYSLAFTEYEKQKNHHKNWPGGYAYFLKSLCALLGYDEFLDYFDIRVSNPKVREEREEFRKKVWKKLGWEYFSMEYPLPNMIIANK
jgi:hypothetical protein